MFRSRGCDVVVTLRGSGKRHSLCLCHFGEYPNLRRGIFGGVSIYYALIQSVSVYIKRSGWVSDFFVSLTTDMVHHEKWGALSSCRGT